MCACVRRRTAVWGAVPTSVASPLAPPPDARCSYGVGVRLEPVDGVEHLWVDRVDRGSEAELAGIQVGGWGWGGGAAR
jgi:hypothetical protein